MRILILSNSEWDDSNSFGSSFTSIFGGLEDVEIANIYCRSGLPNTQTATRFYQITENTLLQNLRNRNNLSGKVVLNRTDKEQAKPDVFSKRQLKFVNFARNTRWVFLFWLKGFIWFFGRWNSDELRKFVDNFEPDLIFLPIYYSVHLNRIGIFLKNYSNTSMIGYVSDDNYTLKQFSLSPFYWIDRFVKRKWVKKAVEQCELLYVISKEQKKDYDLAFNRNCKILYKGARFDNIDYVQKNYDFPYKLIYTGNIGDNRHESLALIGKALDELNNELGDIANLLIYSASPLNKRMRSDLSRHKSIALIGKVSKHEVDIIQKTADVLIHVEPLDIKGKFQSRHSFSTKLVDYFTRSSCIFVVGWKKSASIAYLMEHNAALSAENYSEIVIKLRDLFLNPGMFNYYSKNAYLLGRKNHNIEFIQNELLKDLQTFSK